MIGRAADRILAAPVGRGPRERSGAIEKQNATTGLAVDPVERLRRTVARGGLDPYEAALDALDDVTSLPDLYSLIGYLGDVVEERHTCMQCDAKCIDCCGQLPLVTYSEWKILHAWMMTNMSAEQRSAAVARCERILRDEGTVLPRWMQLGAMDMDSAATRDYVDDIFGNETTTCPLLGETGCTVYPGRPLVCRAYGRMMRTEDDSLYCQRIVDKMVPYREKEGEFFLPIYRSYQEKSYALAGCDSYFTLIPIWLLSHRASDGDLIAETRNIADDPDWPVLETRWGFWEAFADD